MVAPLTGLSAESSRRVQFQASVFVRGEGRCEEGAVGGDEKPSLISEGGLEAGEILSSDSGMEIGFGSIAGKGRSEDAGLCIY